MTLPARLDAMEAALVQQREELRELREMKEKATLTRDDSKKELSIFEKTMWDAKRKRDQELVATRKEVERRKDMTGKAEKKTNRATLINDPHQDIMTHEKKGKREIQCKILSYQEAFNRIKEATGVADVAVSSLSEKSLLVLFRVWSYKNFILQLCWRVFVLL